MLQHRFWFTVVCILVFSGLPERLIAAPADPPLTPEQRRILERFQQISWQKGPGRFAVGPQATIQIPDGFQITNSAGAQIYMELSGNPPSANIQSVVTFTEEPFGFYLIFSYEDSGKVDDRDASNLNADELLKQLRENTNAGNAHRKQLGLEPLYIDRWIIPPRYNSTTKQLEWALRGHSESGNPVANWDTRILGRYGMMSVKLVMTNPDEIESVIPGVNQLLQGFSFNAGSDYASWQPGDKVAALGVTALVAGSTTAVAAKLGFFQKMGVFIFKYIYLILAALGAVGARFLGKSASNSSPSDSVAMNRDSALPRPPTLPGPRPRTPQSPDNQSSD
ncbi:Uncharacterized membrane-anchored protein-like protein [Planctopirus limnophila DSM 3776]|uniref:Uncharacterized membrane-anchored protein-like protein n=1 Tax=Planctopirus limnophila (strain ATCC 43296 / DSM 3776 / IFAM 1008 / Mu 290) TaxID=521674 RepID=D5STT5_PLAL2|nr:DUF2167 domain-containing protein [Planctopirus limnophila]ADG66920.1 Uncharacterized membrane-anchored protein-like protein [Planctopirus limnophila DSM 3776]